MEISIRYANTADSKAVSALLGELGFPTDEDETRDRLRFVNKSSSDFVLVADIESEVVAFLSLHVIPYFTIGGTVGRISALTISKAMRHKGIGRKMMDAAENLARKLGCLAIEITSADHREGAHAFYTRLGYPKTSVKFFKYL